MLTYGITYSLTVGVFEFMFELLCKFSVELVERTFS